MSEVVEMPADRPSGELLLREAIVAYKAGNKPKARFLLDLAARQAPDSELVWLWRAYIAKTRAAAQEYVEEVLRINPNNAKALEWYAKLQPMPSTPPTAHWECPLCERKSPGNRKQCPHCQAIVELDDIDVFLTNDGVQRDVMRATSGSDPATGRAANRPVVDQLIEAREVVVKTLGNVLRQVRGLTGATLMGDGSVVLIINPSDLVQESEKSVSNDDTKIAAGGSQPSGVYDVLIVDDSLSVRRVVSNLIRNGGWNPLTAKDGVEALEVLQTSAEKSTGREHSNWVRPTTWSSPIRMRTCWP